MRKYLDILASALCAMVIWSILMAFDSDMRYKQIASQDSVVFVSALVTIFVVGWIFVIAKVSERHPLSRPLVVGIASGFLAAMLYDIVFALTHHLVLNDAVVNSSCLNVIVAVLISVIVLPDPYRR